MKAVEAKIASILEDEVINSKSQDGGCIAQSNIIMTKSGKKYFLKQGYTNGMFSCEANSLSELSKSNTLKVPKVILVDNDFMLLEYIKSGIKHKDFFITFGRKFAELHQFYGKHYGFYEDNFIGATPQINQCKPNTSWVDFYFTNRLLYQYKLAEENGYSDTRMKTAFLNIESKVINILEGSKEKPSLLHGDLWGGNYMVDKNGEPVLIDPALYYGHREVDLAMTKLFGGFTQEFYTSYDSKYPLKDGYEYRERIYMLYHVLNHLNLFGSAYYSQCIQLMEWY